MITAQETTARPHKGAVTLAVLVAALGYFVDIYDLLLFSIVRVPSLKDLGLTGEQVTTQGLFLLNVQMAGMLIGGILSGVLGDLRGRVSVLFGSILLYSLGNIANGLVETIPQYAAARFVAGVGLAGELGAGIALVSELMSKEQRGYGTAIVTSVGVMGAVVAGTVASLWSWRVSYFVGGGLGLLLLALRIGVIESGMFKNVRHTGIARGNFLALFAQRDRLRRYLACILVGLPIWFVIGILITLSPEIGAALGMERPPSAGRAVMFSYAGLVVGDLCSGILSQVWRSRRKVIGVFLLLTALAMAAYFLVGGVSLTAFYTCCVILGFAIGYWAVFMTVASEQFGTNLRATVTTTAPNFVRATVVPLTAALTLLSEHIGILWALTSLGAVTVALALLSLLYLPETFGKDLDYFET